MPQNTAVQTMSDSKTPALNVHWDAALAQDFEGIRMAFAKNGVKLSKSKLGELAIRHFIQSRRRDGEQLDFDQVLEL
jgi:hypothetical protein